MILKRQRKLLLEFYQNFQKEFRLWLSSLWSHIFCYSYVETNGELRERLVRDVSLAIHTDLAPTWEFFCNQLQDYLRSDNPRRFLTWPAVIKPMFVGWSPYGHREIIALLRSPQWHQRWKPLLPEDGLGSPAPYWCYPWSSGNRIHHVYHLYMMEKYLGCRIEQFGKIFEFGGGYGSLCHLIHRLGFSGKYLIADLPPFSALQRYYLSALDNPVREEECSEPQGIVLTNQLEGDAMERQRSLTCVGLFIATWSLSEAPLSVREQTIPHLENYEAFFIAYQENFDGMDNMDYFQHFTRKFPEVEWEDFEIPVLPGHRYLMGKRKNSVS